MQRQRAFLLSVAVLLASCHQRPSALSDDQRSSFLQRSMKAEDVVVRFYYEPSTDEPPNISPGPLILMPVSSQDPRLGTRPAWILYVTLVDLRRGLQVLGKTPLLWKGSARPKQLVVDPFDLPNPHHSSMEIAVTTSDESATAELEANHVCKLLSDLSDAVTSVKARDGIAFYRRTVSCLPPETKTSPD